MMRAQFSSLSSGGLNAAAAAIGAARMDKISGQARVFRMGWNRSWPGCGHATRAASLALMFGVIASASCVASVSAQDDSLKSKPPSVSAPTAPPMPPTRPSTLATPPQAPIAGVPLQAPAAQATTEQKAVANTGPGTLLKLPPASRARMHECALEWQKMKQTGAAAEKIWFTFAQSCLVR